MIVFDISDGFFFIHKNTSKKNFEDFEEENFFSFLSALLFF
jgi:hypothetical protein